VNGDVYRVKAGWSPDAYGLPMGMRWECSLEHWNRYRNSVFSWVIDAGEEQHGIEHNPSYPNPVHALRDIMEQIQEGKQPGLYDFGQVLRWLDIALTGRTMKNIDDYARTAELMLDQTRGEYYLSDGGYSRVWMDLDKGRAWVTDNSTAEVKHRWKALAEE